jgi:hypothetical protein
MNSKGKRQARGAGSVCRPRFMVKTGSGTLRPLLFFKRPWP